ncbi:hypothetical protein HJC23_013573 [Cyclotella cryptica]|uniref:Uncharacterized protein n=1 Tax=Cyclotella cryptica TaxID=29204 RepID=A0ABD3PSZ3_9STRA
MKLSNNGDRASKLLVHHKSKNTHHSSTAVVELDRTLRQLGLLIKSVPAKVKGSVTEVTNKLSLPVTSFITASSRKPTNARIWRAPATGTCKEPAQPSPMSENLVPSKTEASAGGDLSKESKLADTSVLQLNITEAVESLLVGAIQQAKGIEESERGLGTELVLEGSKGGGSLASLGRGEGGGAGDEGGKDGRLHFGNDWEIDKHESCDFEKMGLRLKIHYSCRECIWELIYKIDTLARTNDTKLSPAKTTRPSEHGKHKFVNVVRYNQTAIKQLEIPHKITTLVFINLPIISEMKSAIFASLIAGAAAFAPAQTGKATTSLAAFENELGAQPLSDSSIPLACWMAPTRSDSTASITTRAGFRLPGDISYDGTKFSDIGEGWAGSLQVPVAGALQILAFVGFLELAVMKDVTGEGEFVGDFRNGALDFGWDTFDEETKLSKRAIELNNGRAAMMGILGLMVHEQLGGSVPIVGEL